MGKINFCLLLEDKVQAKVNKCPGPVAGPVPDNFLGMISSTGTQLQAWEL